MRTPSLKSMNLSEKCKHLRERNFPARRGGMFPLTRSNRWRINDTVSLSSRSSDTPILTLSGDSRTGMVESLIHPGRK